MGCKINDKQFSLVNNSHLDSIKIVFLMEHCHNKLMLNFRLIWTLLTLVAIAYGVIEIKFFLNENFVENDTKLKHSLNNFLNGKVN